MCWPGGQGYGNNWLYTLSKAFPDPPDSIEYIYTVDTETVFDFFFVFWRDAGRDSLWGPYNADGAFPDVSGLGYSGCVQEETEQLTVPGKSLFDTAPPGPGEIVFLVATEIIYSDQLDSWPPFLDSRYSVALDDVRVDGVLDANFESGLDGWVPGNLRQLEAPMRVALADTLIPIPGEACEPDSYVMSLSFDGPRPNRWERYQVMRSVPIDVTSFVGDWEWFVFAEGAYVPNYRHFLGLNIEYYPHTCPESGETGWSPFTQEALTAEDLPDPWVCRGFFGREDSPFSSFAIEDVDSVRVVASLLHNTFPGADAFPYFGEFRSEEGSNDVYLDNIYLALEAPDVCESFSDATHAAFTSPTTTSNDAAWADYDSDGDLDVFVANDGANQLFRNDAGSFIDVATGLLAGADNTTSARWVDADDDGLPDLFLTHHLAANQLFINTGSLSHAVGVLDDTSPTSSSTWADVDLDGDLDVYLVRNGAANVLMRNDSGLVFVDVTPPGLDDAGNGTAAFFLDVDQRSVGGTGDFRSDLYLVNDGQPNRLFRQTIAGTFYEDTPLAMATIEGTGAAISAQPGRNLIVTGNTATHVVDWGIDQLSGGVTASLERLLPGATANALHLGPQAAGFAPSLILLSADPDSATRIFDGNLVALESPIPTGAAPRAATSADVNADGEIDLFVATADAGGFSNQLLLNASSCRLESVAYVVLQGTLSNRLGIGAVVNGVPVTDHSSGGQTPGLVPVFHPGSGTIDIRVDWPSGAESLLSGVIAGSTVIAVEPGCIGWSDAADPVIAAAGAARRAAWGDYDADGDPDLYVARDGANQLLRNDDGAFADLSTALLADAGTASSVTWIDANDDGWVDLHVTNHGGPGRLLENTGGFFSSVSGAIEVGGAVTDAAWGDIDDDGDLDVYVARSGESNVLLRNDGDFAFVDVTTAPLDDAGTAIAVELVDVDDDRDLDVLLLNDVEDNRLLINVDGVFSDATPAIIGTFDARIAAWDGALLPRLVLSGSGGTSYLDNTSTADAPSFALLPLPAGLSGQTGLLDATFADVAGSPEPELIIASDVSSGRSGAYELSTGAEVTGHTIDLLTRQRWVAVADYDGDAHLDVLFGTSDAAVSPNLLLSGGCAASGEVLTPLRLVGTNAPIDGTGARVEVRRGGGETYEFAARASNDFGQTSDRMLVPDPGAGLVRVTWPSGLVSTETSAPDLVIIEPPLYFRSTAGVPDHPSASTISPAWADMDGDGDDDLALSAFTGSFLYENLGNGWFADASAGLPGTRGAASLTWGDADGDGTPDLLALQAQGTNVNEVWMNDGGGTFTVTIDPDLGTEGTDGSWVDYDGDGDFDVFYTSTTPAFAPGGRWVENTGSGTFAVHQNLPGQGPAAYGPLAWTDVSGDGALDVAYSRTLPLGTPGPDAFGVPIWLNVGVFGPLTTLGTDPAYGLAFGDFNGDGTDDLYVSFDGPNRLYASDGAGTFLDVTPHILRSPLVASSVSWQDVDLDGDLDLATCGASGMAIFRNDAGTFAPYFVASEPSTRLAWSDYDRDGDVDAYVTGGASDRLLKNRLLEVAARLEAAGFPGAARGGAGGTARGSVTSTWAAFDVRDAHGAPAIGARVEVTSASGTLARIVSPGGTGQDSPVLGFGLGGDTSFDVTITYPTGEVQTATGLAAGNVFPVTPSTIVGVEAPAVLPAMQALHHARPNPFNPRTTLAFDLPEPTRARLVIYDVTGRVVRTLVDGDTPAGFHRVVWDGRDEGDRDVASGVYFYRLETPDGVQRQRMTLLR